ncbi:MAG TPA: XdhC/CoxI family protein [Ktedonobacterales bacterium]|nr:XdhC/CoxI family protein [Ktedonobacterales bacterium]
MREVLDDIERWHAEGKRIARATVVSVVGSAPRAAGATLAISDAGDISGSVSGGCVEPDVIEQAQAILRATRPGATRPDVTPTAKLLTYGVSEEQNVERIGLSCGGEIRVFVQALPDDWRDLAAALHQGRPAVEAIVIAGAPDTLGRTATWIAGLHAPIGDLGAPALTEAAGAIATQLLRQGESEVRLISTERTGEPPMKQPQEVFFAVHQPQPTLLIVGAGHITIPLTRLAKVVGYRVVVIDAREAFATRERLPDADELIVDWPDEAMARLPLHSATAVAVLTHDDKFDVPALNVALRAEVGYVGAIGSRGTRMQRDKRLREAGLSDEQIGRIHGPIGLDIGAGPPEEIALAILAQVVAARHGKA